MEHYSPNSGFMLAWENSRDSIYDQNVPGTPVFYTLGAALSPESHLVPHSPVLSGVSRGSVATSPGTWSPGLQFQPPQTPTTTPMTPAYLLDYQWNGFLSDELHNRLREIYSPETGSPVGLIPGSPAGLVPGSPAGLVPGSPAGLIPGSPAGLIPGSSAGFVPGSPAFLVPGSSVGFVPDPPFARVMSVSGSPLQQSTPTNTRSIDNLLEQQCTYLESQSRNQNFTVGLNTPKRNNNMTNVLRINNSDIGNSTRINTPKINTPRMNTPRMNTPKINTPRMNIPRMNTPKMMSNTHLMNNSPRMNTSSRTLVINDYLLTANNSSFNSTLLNVQSTETLGGEAINDSETPPTTQNFVRSIFGSRVALSTPNNQSTQALVPSAESTPIPTRTPTPTTPIMLSRIPFLTTGLHTVGTPIIQTLGSTPGTPMLATRATSTPTPATARSSRTPRFTSSLAKRSGSSSIGRFVGDKEAVLPSLRGSNNPKAYITSTPQTKRLSTYTGVPGSAPSRLLALRAISSPGMKRCIQTQKPRPTPTSVKRDLFLNKTVTKENKTSETKNSLGSDGYLGFFDSDSDSDNDAMENTNTQDDTLGLGVTLIDDAELDTDMEDTNVTLPSEGTRSDRDSSLVLDDSVKMESSNSPSVRKEGKFRPKRCLTSSKGTPYLDSSLPKGSPYLESDVGKGSPYLVSGAGNQPSPAPVWRTKRPLISGPKQRH